MLQFFRIYKNRKKISIPYNKVRGVRYLDKGKVVIITNTNSVFQISDDDLLCECPTAVEKAKHFEKCFETGLDVKPSAMLEIGDTDFIDMKDIDYTCLFKDRIHIKLDSGLLVTITEKDNIAFNQIDCNLDNQFRFYNGDY